MLLDKHVLDLVLLVGDLVVLREAQNTQTPHRLNAVPDALLRK